MYLTKDELKTVATKEVIDLITQGDEQIVTQIIAESIDLMASSTRRDDLLLDENTLNRTWVLRKYLAEMNPIEAMEFMEKQMKQTRNNQEFLATMNN